MAGASHESATSMYGFGSNVQCSCGIHRLEVYTFKATPFRNYGFFLEKTTRILEKFYLNFHQNEEGDAVPRVVNK